ncbi:hypothetical protein [Tumebacillus flagellatus]|uniref:hypothetical protein n=1 Tax=Tumebacillus flagellatus TaxID=1157490 RepID=UPI001267F2FF|nr:hypothetical protein [Tumebacillus flagellatus]
MQMFVANYMVPGEDFGTIEGVNKPTLLKSGAEKLCDVYGLAAGEPRIDYVRDDSKSPTYISYTITLPLVSRADGRVIMHGVGSCNSHEKKYKWRWVFENELPPNLNPQLLKTRSRNGRNGSYLQYQIPNDEVDDLDNTLLKMAKKRALVDAVLSATRSSALFTQDVEDMDLEIKSQDTSKRDQQRQDRAAGNQQSTGYTGNKGGKNPKGQVYDLRTQMGMSWDDLGKAASAALGREIKKVVQDVKDNEWQTILDHMIRMNGGGEPPAGGDGIVIDESKIGF